MEAKAEVEKENEGCMVTVKVLVGKYGHTKIFPSTCYNWLCQLGFKYCTPPQKANTLLMVMKNLQQLPILNIGKEHIDVSSSQHIKP